MPFFNISFSRRRITTAVLAIIPDGCSRVIPIHCGLGGEHPQLADAEVGARFEDGWTKRHARSLRRRRHDVTLAGTSRTPERARGDQRKRRAGVRPADRLYKAAAQPGGTFRAFHIVALCESIYHPG